MAPPPVTIYVTSLTSQPKVRKHIDLLRRSLKGLEIPYEEYDLVMDEEAKIKWQRSKPPGMVVGLPGYLVGGEWVGTMDEFEDAVETQTLETFLKQDLDLSAPAPGPISKDSANASEANTSFRGGAHGAGAEGKQKTVQEVELERLMRDMTEADLDKLMEELSVEVGGGGGVSVPAPVLAEPEPEAEAGAGDKEGTESEKENNVEEERERLAQDVAALHGGEVDRSASSAPGDNSSTSTSTSTSNTGKDSQALGSTAAKAPAGSKEPSPAAAEQESQPQPHISSSVPSEQGLVGVETSTAGSEETASAIQASIDEQRAISDIREEEGEKGVLDELKREVEEEDREEKEIQKALEREG